MLLGNTLRDLRNEKNLSQKQLAKRVGVNASTIALYETGDRLPSLQRLIDLSRALGVTTDFLLGLSKQKDYFLDVSGLSPSQIASLEQIIENYRATLKHRTLRLSVCIYLYIDIVFIGSVLRKK